MATQTAVLIYRKSFHLATEEASGADDFKVCSIKKMIQELHLPGLNAFHKRTLRERLG